MSKRGYSESKMMRFRWIWWLAIACLMGCALIGVFVVRKAREPIPPRLAASGNGSAGANNASAGDRDKAASTASDLGHGGVGGLKERLETYEKRISELKDLVTFLITMSAIYAVVLGVASYASAKDASESASKTLRELTELKTETLKNYPTFSRLEKNISTMLGEIAGILPDTKNPSGQEYRNVPPQKREWLYFWERALAGMQFVDLGTYGEKLADVYHGYANFYASRYWAQAEEQNPGDGDAAKPVPESDLLRALVYYERSLTFKPKQPAVLNDKAFYLSDYENDERTRQARRAFEESYEANSDQQRPCCGLALISYFYEKNYKAAREWIERAVRAGAWQPGEDGKDHKQELLFHKAYILSALGANERNPAKRLEWLVEALQTLEVIGSKPFENFWDWWAESRQDRFAELVNEPSLKERLAAFEAKTQA